MKYINLINQIPELDKQRMINYIDRFGVSKEYFIGLDKWLQPWSHANQTLYRLLGEKLIYKIPYEYEVTRAELSQQLDNLIDNSFFFGLYDTFIHKVFDEEEADKETLVRLGHIAKVLNFADYSVLLDNKLDTVFKHKSIHKKQTLQISKGMKPVKAIQKVINYFDFILPQKEYEELKSSFEEFRIAHSRVFNTKTIKGQLCFSIHPFDFITMSDNSLNWTSCMNWRERGCYRIGTVEMMNSNNVVCCYIESDDIPFYFNDEDQEQKEEYRWNNKKFRELAYVTKDIIINGKSYPYKNKDTDDLVIKTLKDLALKNLGWKYSFGPEVYRDMDHFFSGRSMNIIRNKIANGTTKKNSILFDTNGMYNDILNVATDHLSPFKCYRNKVDKTKIYSLSGKAPCLCCNKPVIYPQYEDIKINTLVLDYNDRYENVEEVLCEECKGDFECYYCKKESKTKYPHKVKVYLSYNREIVERSICDKCFKAKIRKCPDCGKPIILSDNVGVAPLRLRGKRTVPEIYKENRYSSIKYYDYILEGFCNDNYDLEALYICPSCFEKRIKNKEIDRRVDFGCTYFKNESAADPFRVTNLKRYDIDKFDFSQVVYETRYFSSNDFSCYNEEEPET